MLLPLLGIGLPLVERRLIDQVIIPGQLALLPSTIAAYAALWLALQVGQQVASLLRGYLTERYLVRLRQRLFDHCGGLAVAFAHRQHSARVVALFTSDLPLLAGFVSSALVLGLASVVGIFAALVMMFNLSPQLAVAGGLAPLVVAGLGMVLTRPLRPAARRAQEKVSEITERLQEHLAGIREVVAFGREHAERLAFASSLEQLLRLRMRVQFLDSGFQSGQSLFSLLVTLVLLGYGSYLVIQGVTTLGTLIAMRSLFNLLFQPISQMLGLISSGQQALASADRIQTFLDEQPQVVEAPAARRPAAVRGRIAFEGVSFAYTPDRPVLRDLSFVAEAGETIALVGASGAGKSTIASLVSRFYDPTAGRVLLDGVELRELKLADLRRHIGCVFPDTFLFSTTIGDNIAFGLDGADEEQVIAAARAANAWEFVERLPKGLATPVGERGVQLSEGQRQRIGIARALLRDPRVLILDEPTSALDARSEQLVQTALAASTRDRTTLVIAHRLATVEHADRILVIDGGRVAEQGTHSQLLARGGLYRQLFELQFGRQAAAPRLVPARGFAEADCDAA
ncbi:MAG: ABC transporter ATP-binding protein [Chloroflexi bacterium]|nr:ABC transporter ATP-binding protein [Chloroflexota bacterium]